MPAAAVRNLNQAPASKRGTRLCGLGQYQGHNHLVGMPIEPTKSGIVQSFGEHRMVSAIQMRSQNGDMGGLGQVEPQNPVSVAQVDAVRNVPAVAPPLQRGSPL